MSYSLGISSFFHESSVAIFHKGELIGFCREEYFSRVKGDNSFPRLTLEYYKNKYNLTPNKIDFICFYEKPLKSFINVLKETLPITPESRELIYNNISQIKNSGFEYAKF